MPMKLKYYYKKQPVLVFAPYDFLIFLGGYYKFRTNWSEGFNKNFGVGIFVKLLAAKIDENCI